MEIILTMFTLLSILLLVILIGTRGKPWLIINHFELFIKGIINNRIQLFVVSLLLILSILVVYVSFYMPYVGFEPAQPISFSHRLHGGDKNIDCKFCHSYVDRSIHPGMPPAEKCLFCHEYIIANHPEIRKIHNYFDNNTPIPWKKVFILPEHVVFNHERHIKKDIACEECHGDVKATDRLIFHEFEMGFCVECHRSKKANVSCWLSCHN